MVGKYPVLEMRRGFCDSAPSLSLRPSVYSLVSSSALFGCNNSLQGEDQHLAQKQHQPLSRYYHNMHNFSISSCIPVHHTTVQKKHIRSGSFSRR